MFLPSDYDEFYKPPFEIEIKEFGEWHGYGKLYDNLPEVLRYASHLTRHNDRYPEERLRIVDGVGNII
jgi:hypothetical protein